MCHWGVIREHSRRIGLGTGGFERRGWGQASVGSPTGTVNSAKGLQTRVLLGSHRVVRVLPGSTGSTGFYRFYGVLQVLRGSTGFYRVLQGSTGSTGFYRL